MAAHTNYYSIYYCNSCGELLVRNTLAFEVGNSDVVSLTRHSQLVHSSLKCSLKTKMALSRILVHNILTGFELEF